MNKHIEERKYCENRDSRGYKSDLSGRRVLEPDEVDASLTAKLCAVKKIE
jgi:hypothetical protein